jgi:phosphoadenosine phosphosulfate reductase
VKQQEKKESRTMPKIELSNARVRELEEKVAKSKEIFQQAFERFRVESTRLIWSGGKDSTLTLWICRQYCQQKGIELPKAFTIDEGDAFEEIDQMLHKYSKKWGVCLDWGRNDDVLKAANHTLNAEVRVPDLNERNQAEIKRIGFDLKAFPFEAESYVGNHLMKTVVFNTYLEDNAVKAVFQGLRWDEQKARAKDPYFEDVEAAELTPAHTRYRPILHFSERDIWDTTLHFEIPFCSLYQIGYRSLGAKTTSLKTCDTPAWEQDLENTEERAGRRQDKEKTMERLRQLGYM